MGLKRQIQLQEVIKDEKKNNCRNDWSHSTSRPTLLASVSVLVFSADRAQFDADFTYIAEACLCDFHPHPLSCLVNSGSVISG